REPRRLPPALVELGRGVLRRLPLPRPGAVPVVRRVDRDELPAQLHDLLLGRPRLPLHRLRHGTPLLSALRFRCPSDPPTPRPEKTMSSHPQTFAMVDPVRR